MYVLPSEEAENLARCIAPATVGGAMTMEQKAVGGRCRGLNCTVGELF
jgi:hypothetical protein